MDTERAIGPSIPAISRGLHAASILFRDGDSDENRAMLVELGLTPLDADAVEATDAFAAIDRDSYLRQFTYTPPDERIVLEDELTRWWIRAGSPVTPLPLDHVSSQLIIAAGLALDDLEGCKEFVSATILMWLVPLASACNRYYCSVDKVAPSIIWEIASSLRLNPYSIVRSGSTAIIDEIDIGRPRSIARFLTEPWNSGLYIGRMDIVRAARASDVPVGFGSRLNMLETLLDGATRYEAIDMVVNKLQTVLLATKADYSYLAVEEEIAGHEEIWSGRLAQSTELLKRIQHDASNH